MIIGFTRVWRREGSSGGTMSTLILQTVGDDVE